MTAQRADSSSRLEDVVEQWVAKKMRRTLSDLRRELSLSEALAERGEALERELADHATSADQQVATLLALPQPERAAWVDSRSWHEDGAFLGEALLDLAESHPVAERLELARLAARVAVRAVAPLDDPLFQARLDDILGRAGLLEVRALRRRGELQAARRRFAELDALLETDQAPLRFWLTLEADRGLTAALLARDEGRLDAAATLLRRTERLLRVAGGEDDDFELLTAQVRTDLARGDGARALERFARAPNFSHRGHRLDLGFLAVHAALSTGSPLLARRALLGLANELGPRPETDFAARFAVLEAAVTLLEGRPAVALEGLAEPVARLRERGEIEASLRAALIATRAELQLEHPEAARAALAAGVLETFHDLPRTAAVVAALERIVALTAAGVPEESWLARLEAWLIQVVDCPGVELPLGPLR